MQWNLVAAAVEAAVIKFFKLDGEDAEKMRGRSRITFSKKTKRLLICIEKDDGNADTVTRAKWLRTAAGHHTRLANKLINVVRYMKTKTGDAQRAAGIQRRSIKTIAAYTELTGNLSKQEKLTHNQKDQIKESWTAKGNTQSGRGDKTAAQEEVDLHIKIEEVQILGSDAS